MAEAGPGGGAAATGVGVEAAEAPVARAGAAGAWLIVAAVAVVGCRGTLGASVGDFSVVE